MITLKNVTKIFENKGIERVTALRNVNLTFPEKGMVFISGFSGAGKSTLLSIIGGLDTPTSGNVIIDNYSFKNVSNIDLDRYRNNYVGFVFENVNLINSMTIEENIKVSCAFNGNNPTQTQMDYVLDKLKLTPLRDRKPAQLSMGQRQKVGIARALVKDPYIYLADDPTGHVDASRADEIWSILKDISKKRLVIAVTHDQRIIDKFADRIIRIDEGEIVSDEITNKEYQQSKKVNVSDALSDVTFSKSAQEIITQKHRFSFKNLFKLSNNSLAFKPARIAMIVFLATLALIFFSTFSVMNNFDRELVLARSVTQNDMDYVTFLKSDGSNVDDEQYIKIKQHYYDSENKYDPTFKSSKLIEFKGANIKIPSRADGLGISYVVIQQDTTAQETCLGQKLVYGRMPVNEKEWVVSDYIAEQLKDKARKESIEALIGTDGFEVTVSALNINSSPNVKIVGVYKTDYKKYVIGNGDMRSNGYRKYEFDYNLNYIYSIAFVGEKYVDNIISLNNASTKFNISAKYESRTKGETYEKYYKEGKNVVKLSTLTKDNTEAIFLDGLFAECKPSAITISWGKTVSDIIVPVSFFNDIYYTYGLFNESVTTGKIDFDFLRIKGGYSTADKDANVRILKSGESTLVKLTFGTSEEKLYNIKGIISTDKFIISDEDYNNIYTNYNFLTSGMIVRSTASESLLKDVIVNMEKQGFDFTSTTSEKINEFSRNIEVFKLVLVVGSVFFAMFAVVLVYFFISTVISDRKRDIGVLRTFGARGRDIAGIFLFSGAILILIVFALSSLGVWLISFLGNLAAQNQFGTLFNVFNLNVMDFIVNLLLCIGTVALGTCIPVLRFAKKGPYENLRDYDG